jgi:hypothetical protein
MKSRINVSLDEEIIEKLRVEENYSDVINKQLKEYYLGTKTENLQKLSEKLANLKKTSKETLKSMREIKNQIAKIKEKEEVVLSKFKSREKLILAIEEKRERALKNPHPFRRITIMMTPEEEADHILKGGRPIS